MNSKLHDYLNSLHDVAKDEALLEVVALAWEEPFTTKSDFARKEATFVAMAIEEGFITLKDEGLEYTTRFRITTKGIQFCLHQGREYQNE